MTIVREDIVISHNYNKLDRYNMLTFLELCVRYNNLESIKSCDVEEMSYSNFLMLIDYVCESDCNLEILKYLLEKIRFLLLDSGKVAQYLKQRGGLDLIRLDIFSTSSN